MKPKSIIAYEAYRVFTQSGFIPPLATQEHVEYLGSLIASNENLMKEWIRDSEDGKEQWESYEEEF